MVTLRLKQKQAQQQQNSSKIRATTAINPITHSDGSQTPSAARKQQNINLISSMINKCFEGWKALIFQPDRQNV